jgi:hypothetical protein
MVLVALHGGDWEGKHLETAEDVRVSRGEDVRIKSSVCKTKLNMSRSETEWMKLKSTSPTSRASEQSEPSKNVYLLASLEVHAQQKHLQALTPHPGIFPSRSSLRTTCRKINLLSRTPAGSREMAGLRYPLARVLGVAHRFCTVDLASSSSLSVDYLPGHPGSWA